MRRILYAALLLIIAACAGCSSLSPEEKAAKYASDSLAHAQAVYNLEHANFMLQARQAVVRGKRMPIVDNETGNFVCAFDTVGIVQLMADIDDVTGLSRTAAYRAMHPTRMYAPGNRPVGNPNGIGGITVKGRIKLLKIVTEKSGRMTFDYEVTSMPQRVKFSVSLPKNGTYGEAIIAGEKKGGEVKMIGEVRRFDPSAIVIGSSW